MGIKQTDIESFLEPESQGFLYDTARSFLKRHSNPDSLMSQLKGLWINGQLDPCRDMIQLIIREGHILADKSDLYLLRARIAYEESESIGEVMAWIQQAKICEPDCKKAQVWDQLVKARIALNEADYENGQLILEELIEDSEVMYMARYELAHHLFWKNLNIKRSVDLLENVTLQRPGFIKAWSCLGYAYNRMNMKAKAQQAFGHCIELDTNPERIKVYKQQIAS